MRLYCDNKPTISIARKRVFDGCKAYTSNHFWGCVEKKGTIEHLMGV